MSFRGGRGGVRGGIYIEDAQVPQPDPTITAAENALVLQTKGKIIDGFPGRSSFGTKGKPIVLRTNFFKITTAFEAKQKEITLYRYEIEIRQDLSKPKKRRLIELILTNSIFKNVQWATDYASILVTAQKLDLQPLMQGSQWRKLTLPPENGAASQPQGEQAPDFVRQARDRNTFDFSMKYQSAFDLREMIQYLQSTSSGATYQGRADLIHLLNIIVTKAPNTAANVQNVGQNKFYPYTGHPGLELYELGGGLQALRGYFSSVRPAINRLLLNINVTSGAFFKPMHLLELREQSRSSNDQFESFIQMLKVEARYVKDGQSQPFMKKTKTIVGFAKSTKNIQVKRFGNANEVKFSVVDRYIPNAKPSEVTVAQYFKRHHGISLKSPGLPVLNVGTRADPQYLPMELCTVHPGQAYRRLLSGDQTSEMLKFAARFPNLNAMSIAGTSAAPGNGIRLLRLDNQTNSLSPWGFRVSTDMISVPGRILPTPTVVYGKKSLQPRGGSWNCANEKFTRPGKFSRWQVVVVNRQGPRGNALRGDRDKLVNDFDKFLRAYGIGMGERGTTQEITLDQLTVAHRETNDRQIKALFQKAEDKRVDIMLVIIPEVDRWLYARIKFFGDVQHGIGTVCSVGSKIEKENGQGMYFGNLALKFNLKGGGVSHTVTNAITGPIDASTMLVGIDVTHPSPGSSEGAPSIACVVASIDKEMFQWPGSIRTQTGRQEMVHGLEQMVLERLALWQKKNQNRLPTKIVIYRDGVSEGQYQRVLEEELPSFEKAFEKKYGAKNKWPKIAIIIVGKRHHTRFYPTRKEDADYSPQREKGSWNPLPGTVVDRGITGKILHEFYLQAHQGLQGTARPAHYVVIKDEIHFNADALEQFTHSLCYLFNRATKAVSICPPAYYADLLCERGRSYLFSTLAENHASDSSVFDGSNDWTGGVHARMRETTWYV